MWIKINQHQATNDSNLCFGSQLTLNFGTRSLTLPWSKKMTLYIASDSHREKWPAQSRHFSVSFSPSQTAFKQRSIFLRFFHLVSGDFSAQAWESSSLLSAVLRVPRWSGGARTGWSSHRLCKESTWSARCDASHQPSRIRTHESGSSEYPWHQE